MQLKKVLKKGITKLIHFRHTQQEGPSTTTGNKGSDFREGERNNAIDGAIQEGREPTTRKRGNQSNQSEAKKNAEHTTEQTEANEGKRTIRINLRFHIKIIMLLVTGTLDLTLPQNAHCIGIYNVTNAE